MVPSITLVGVGHRADSRWSRPSHWLGSATEPTPGGPIHHTGWGQPQSRLQVVPSIPLVGVSHIANSRWSPATEPTPGGPIHHTGWGQPLQVVPSITLVGVGHRADSRWSRPSHWLGSATEPTPGGPVHPTGWGRPQSRLQVVPSITLVGVSHRADSRWSRPSHWLGSATGVACPLIRLVNCFCLFLSLLLSLTFLAFLNGCLIFCYTFYFLLPASCHIVYSRLLYSCMKNQGTED